MDVKKERSFIAVKPEGVKRGLVGKIISTFEKRGYKLVGMKLAMPGKDLIEKHYEEHKGKPFFPKIVGHMSSGPIVAMVWEGKDIINQGRKMIGTTNPLNANPGTLRGDYCLESGLNLIHGSDGPESGKREISLWFKEEELMNFELENKGQFYENN